MHLIACHVLGNVFMSTSHQMSYCKHIDTSHDLTVHTFKIMLDVNKANAVSLCTWTIT